MSDTTWTDEAGRLWVRPADVPRSTSHPDTRPLDWSGLVHAPKAKKMMDAHRFRALAQQVKDGEPAEVRARHEAIDRAYERQLTRAHD